jgi:FkbM family methyltransferase
MKNDLEKVLSNVQLYNLDECTVVVFGAGNTSLLYQQCFEREGIHPVYYIDNSEAKQGTVFHGVSVISVEKLVSLQQTFSKPLLILICSAQINVCSQMQLQLQKYGLTYTTVDSFVFGKNIDSIKAVYDLLEDDYSKEIYLQIIKSRINNSPIPESLVNNAQYFLLPPFLERSEREIFVDLGAYVGDTVEQYINKKSGVFGKIFAFEPDARNFLGLEYRVERLKKEWAIPDDKLCLIYGGVGAITALTNFTKSSEGLNSNFNAKENENTNEVIIYNLDNYFKEERINFIKADIENYELNMLHGAESIIKRDRPLLAVCIYHNASDMFTIPLFIKELCNDYILKIRHHTYNFAETVLYAYIKRDCIDDK